MGRFALLALPLLVAACASTANAPAQYYRAAGQPDQIAVAGSLKQSQGLLSATNQVSITINGQTVASGEFSGGSAEFSGAFNGKPVLADCSAVAAGNLMHQLTWGYDRTDVKCLVFVAGERAANLMLIP